MVHVIDSERDVGSEKELSPLFQVNDMRLGRGMWHDITKPMKRVISNVDL